MKHRTIRLYDTYGWIAIASLLVCTLTGVFLIVPYDPAKAYTSVSTFVIFNKAASLMRNMHYWSAQFFLVTTLLHFFDHLAKNSGLNQFVHNGRRVTNNRTWLRLVLSLAVVFYVMLTGFILKNDADSRQAHALLQALFASVPFMGNYLSSFFAGSGSALMVPYLHHAATGTIITFIVVYEHVRSISPKYRTFIITSLLIIGLSLLFQAPLTRTNEPIMKGPWFFAGIQEILHFIPKPVFIVVMIVSLMSVIYFLPFFGERKRRHVVKVIYGVTFVYVVLSISGYFFRGVGYERQYPWKENYRAPLVLQYIPLPVKEDDNDGVFLTGEGAEGCMSCHSKVTGISISHNIATTGCYACHRGNRLTLNADEAHRGMYKVPGTMQNAGITCGGADCHSDIVTRVSGSLMASMSGVIAVDKWVFGEADSPDSYNHVHDLGNSPADRHLKNLCAGCHLGMDKQEPGSIGWLERGGGCLACHLEYTAEATQSFLAIRNNGAARLSYKEAQTMAHPSIDINITNDRCESCHSRSGRISMSYQGWHETGLKTIPDDTQSAKSDNKTGARYKQLPDGRVFERQPADIHHEAGMLCIDCHTSQEVMGDGKKYRHKEEAVKVACMDCHPQQDKAFRGINLSDAGRENQLIAWLRNRNVDNAQVIMVNYSETGKETGLDYGADSKGLMAYPYALVNTRIAVKGSQDKREGDITPGAYLVKKSDNKTALPLKNAASVCSAKAHKRLECGACHSAWVPQCLGCHNTYEKNTAGFDMTSRKTTRGTWIEYAGEMIAEAPVIGIKEAHKSDNNQRIGTFSPGMIMTIDKGSFTAGKQKVSVKEMDVFHRLYAPVSAHTTQKSSRSCVSCHLNPAALGLGRGKMILQAEGVWLFEALYATNKADGLPEDAWTALFGNTGRSTRLNMRPFNSSEQKRILRVGACLTCHDEHSDVMQRSLYDFNIILNQATRSCIIPAL